jgi:diguanylate cyclase (GGDEF)-like protein
LAPDDPHSDLTRPEAQSQPRTPDFGLTLTRALLETLDPARILYVILSGITAGDGLGFNRAFLLLADEGDRALRGHLAIGPETRGEASRIWEAMEAERFDLARVMSHYDEFRADPQASRLVRLIENLSVSLPVDPAGDTFAGLVHRVLTEKRPLMVNGIEVAFTPTPLSLKNFALAPLLAQASDQASDPAHDQVPDQQRVLGVIVVDNRWTDQTITESALADLQSLANLAAVGVERARLHERIKRMAEQDGLTGLLNRRRFDELAQATFSDCRQHGEDLSILLLDIDRFKDINDHHGHLAGDDVLRGLSHLVTQRVRRGDLAARYGGDELAIILPRAAGPQAHQVAQDLARAVRAQNFAPNPDPTAPNPDPTAPNQPTPLRATISIGVATAHHTCPTHTQLLSEADQALYQAKNAGRDQVQLFRP